MKTAYILFDGITLLDFIGVYDPLCRLRSQGHLPDFSWDLCAMTPAISDSFGLTINVDKVAPDLGQYDMIIVPGGFGTRELQRDTDFLRWLATAKPVPKKVSICTGALLLGAAGFLRGHRATTHFNEYGALKNYCDQVLPDRIVDDGAVITAGAVASSLDLGLYLCRQLTDVAAAQKIQKSMDYVGKI